MATEKARIVDALSNFDVEDRKLLVASGETPLKTIDESVNPESKLDEYENEEKIIEETIKCTANCTEDEKDGILLFVKNNILDKNLMFTDKKETEYIKNSHIFPEIEFITEYVVPDIKQVKDLLEIKLKNIENLTLEIIDKNIMKINDFLYSDEIKSITHNNNRYTHMLAIVRNFLIKKCIRKKNSKTYSTKLFTAFYDHLLETTP